MNVRAVILAAGKGTRMKSDLPKVLHPVLSRPMIRYAVDVAVQVTGEKPVLVIGHGADQVRDVMGGDVEYAYQAEQLGTGHAVQQAEAALRGKTDLVLVTSGDMPLFTAETLQRMVDQQIENSGPLTMLTVIEDDPRGFGRIVRGPHGAVLGIVEEAVATPDQLGIKELNVGAYCFTDNWLWDALKRIPLSPRGEYYLTDLVEIAVAEGRRVQAIRVPDPEETIGVNTPAHLAEAESIMRARLAAHANNQLE